MCPRGTLLRPLHNAGGMPFLSTFLVPQSLLVFICLLLILIFSPSSSLPCGLDCFSPLLLISIIEFCTESSMSCIELIFSSSLSTLSDCSFFHSFCDSRAMIIAGSSGSFASSAAVLAISSLCDLSIGICAAVSSSRPPLNYLYLCCPPPVQTPGFPSPRMVRFVHLPLCSPPCTRD